MRRSDPQGATAAPARVRCAIYTRKSSEEGLDQEFNSLDAQREAGEAYIQSQRREGWVLAPQAYDDGGFSGANMDRPALTRLLAAVEASTIDCVVVYKVDRLSRSLLDFTRMLSLFEQHNVSFVAVTQQFNTRTSLGRLTLNILLSFAQFERELIGERTRDKMSAARRKGKWVGGYPALGYDIAPGGGKLLVNPQEAEHVHAIFELFQQTRSIADTLTEIEGRGWQLKAWTSGRGELYGGGRFTANSLRRLLTNVLYTGDVLHRGDTYAGEHEAIVSRALWEDVQKQMKHLPSSFRPRPRNKHLALLAGLLHCDSCGTRMVYSYASKNGRTYPYYVCLNAQRKGWAHCPSKSLAARVIEQSVLAHLLQANNPIFEPSQWEHMDRRQQVDTLRGLVERVGFDGKRRQVSIRFCPGTMDSAEVQA
ncbi:MAG TPA: recombinase family protein [Acidobacteriaceae bacterium]|nr:recombinase family protein [Acidobacteriaceae bacterium]